MSVDKCLVTEEPEAGADVLLDEISFLVHFIPGERQLRECSRSRARSADNPSADIVVPDRVTHGGAAQHGNELDLVTAAEKDSACLGDHLRDVATLSILSCLDDGKYRVGNPGRSEVSLPVFRASSNVA